MRSAVLATLVAFGLAGPSAARAQDRPPNAQRAAQLRQMIEDRFAERLALELRLDADQTEKVRTILLSWAARRRAMERDEQRVRERLNASMRPGVAADERVVNGLIDELMAGRVAYVQSFRDELADLAPVLSAVQRAQYVLLRDRLMQRVQDIRNQRAPEPTRRTRPPL